MKDSPQAKRSVLQWVHGAEWAGTERHVWGLLRGLRSRGWTCVLGTAAEGPLVEAARAGGFEVLVWPWSGSWRWFPALRSWVARESPGVVHVHSGYAPLLSLVGLSGVATVATRHGLHPNARGVARRTLRTLRIRPANLADVTIAISEHDRRMLVETESVAPRRVVVVHNGIPEEPEDAADGQVATPAGDPAEAAESPAKSAARSRWGLSENEALVGFVGRLSPEKAPGRFLDLVEALHARCPAPRSDGREWRAVICGSGPEETALRARAVRAGVADRILWIPPHSEGRALVRALDVLVLPSLREGVPYVLLEALHAGTPVCATPVGGIPEVLAGAVLGAGCLEWGVESWSRRVSAILERGDAAWRVAAQERALRYREVSTIEEVERIYLRLIDRSPEVASLAGR